MPIDAKYPGLHPFRSPVLPAPQVATAADRIAAAWWLWPHLLSLDAPLVAVIWQACMARAAHARLLWCHPCVLGLGVWLIYLADRLADTTRAIPGDRVTPRHAFHARWRWRLSFLAATVAAMLVLLAPRVLSRTEFLHGLSLLTLAVTYFCLVHGKQTDGWTLHLPKEAVVGSMFAVGTAFFPWFRGGMDRLELVAGAAIFAGICFCNCALITVWERQVQDVRNRASLLNAFPWLMARLRGLCLILACIAGAGLVYTHSSFFLPLGFAGLLLAILDLCQKKVSSNALRVLADAALLTPLFFGSLCL